MKYFISLLFLTCSLIASAQLKTIDSLQLINLIDQRIDSFQQQFNIPGAVFSMVKDGQLFYHRGIGYQNIEADKKINPETSQFRVASITKTFTAMAIMQLVEHGKLDLHADIRTYLPQEDYPWQAPYSFTIHHLLTHTAGMETSGFRVCQRATEEKTLDSFVSCSISNQVFKPGEVFYYSNKGYGILGLLIEKMSGMKYEDYIAKYILEPVGMNQSTAYQHTTDHPIAHPVQPYYWNEGFETRQRLFLVNPSASNLNTTGADMAKFMSMILDSGQVDGSPIISQESFELMATAHVKPNHDYESMSYGMMIERYRGYSGYNHGGGIDGFGSYYILFPELNIGLFMSESGGEENAAYAFRVIYSVLNELVPKKDSSDTNTIAIDQAVKQAEHYAGRYQNTTVTKSTFERGQMLFGINEPVVQHEGEGILSFAGTMYEPVDNDTYRALDGNRTIGFSFVEGETYMNERIYWSFEKINWYESAITLRICTIMALVGLLIGLIIRPVILLKRAKRSIRWRSIMTLSSSALIIGFGLLLIGYGFDISLTTGTPWVYRIGLLLTTAGAFVFIFYPMEVYRLWNTTVSVDRFWMIINTLSLLLLMACYWSVNLIGFNYY